MTSRWVVEVQQQRDFEIAWKSFSLEIKNTGVDVPAQYRPGMRLGLRALRVIEAARTENNADMESVGRFYSNIGTQIHNKGLGAQASLAEAIAEAGWPADIHYYENSEEVDLTIGRSMQEGFEASGSQEIGVPLLVVEDGDQTAAFFGPIMSPTPKGEEAVKLWDSFVALALSNNFYELKKHKPRSPDFS